MRSAVRFAKEHLKGRKDIVALEVGVDKGEHAKQMLDGWEELTFLHLVDDYTLDPHRIKDLSFNLSEYRDKVELVKEKSYYAHRRFTDKSLDFVYLDGDHAYDGIIKDILNFYPKVKKGGVLGGHDCTAWYIGVLEAIKQFKRIGWDIRADIDDGKLIEPNFSDWWMVVK
jgi:hypothetical protein